MRVGLFDGGQRGQRSARLDELVESARLAERLGLASVWFNNIIAHDGMTAAALAAQATTRVELGTAVIPTYPRHPHAMAQQAASTQAAAHGRFTLGIGPSHRVVIESRYGLSYDRAYAHTREYLAVLMPLLRSGAVDHAGKRFTVRARLVAADGLPVPVVLAALGPKMLALAGAQTAGTVTWLVGPRTLRDHIVPRVREAAAQAGRPSPRIVVALPLAFTGDAAAARAQAAAIFKTYSSLPSYRAMLDREGVAGPADVALVGDEDAIGEQLSRIAEAGATDFIAAPFIFGEGDDGIGRYLATLARLAPRHAAS